MNDITKLSDKELLQLSKQNNNKPDITSLSDDELLQLSSKKPDNSLASFHEANTSKSEAFGRGALSGSTFGFGNKITPYISAGVAKAFGGEATKDISYNELLEGARDINKQELQTAREKQPVANIVGEIIGGIASPINIASLKVAKGLGGGLKGFVGAGALEGGIAGAGYTRDLTDVEQTSKDVLKGAATGAIISGSLYGAGKALKKGSEIIGIKKPGAKSIAKEFLDEDKLPALRDKLIQAQSEGRDVLLADIGGDKIQGLTRSLRKTKTGSDIIENALTERSNQSGERVLKAIKDNISDAENYLGSIDELTTKRAILSKPLYEKAFKEVVPTNAIKDFTNDDLFKTAFKQAQKDRIIPKDVKINSVQALDGVKKKLDDYIGTAIRQGENEKVRAITGFKNELLSKIDDISPTYKQARTTSGDYFKLQNAVENGKDILTKTPEEVKRTFGNLTDAEKDAYRIGVKEALQNKALSTPEGSNAANRIFNNELGKQRLDTIIDNPKQQAKFRKLMQDEFDFMKTKQRVLGGSNTDVNLANEKDFLQSVGNNIRKGNITGSIMELGAATMDSIKKRYYGLSEKNAKELADILLNPKASISFIEDVIKNETKQAQKGLIKQFALDNAIILQTQKNDGEQE
jgi:hypothetical protein